MAERKRRFLDAYTAKACNRSEACRAVNIDRGTSYDWQKADAAFARAVRDAEEAMLDMAESRLMGLVGEGDLGAICFLLKCRGKARGYVERFDNRVDLTSGGASLQPRRVEIVFGSTTIPLASPEPVALPALPEAASSPPKGQEGTATAPETPPAPVTPPEAPPPPPARRGARPTLASIAGTFAADSTPAGGWQW